MLKSERRVAVMKETQTINDGLKVVSSSEVDPNLLRMLDRGIDDVLAGRTLSHDDAMKEIERIREERHKF